jgi:hypothetical protein
MKTLVPLVLVTATVCGFGQKAARDLSRYASKDLRKLSTNDVAILQAEFRDKTKVELGEKWGWCPLAPWLLSKYNTGGAAWVLVEVYPGYDIPDMSGMKLHFFDRSWRHVCSHSFPTGYRFFLNEVTVQNREQMDRPLIVAKASSAGPFITSPGPKRPAFEQGDFQLQYYALIETNLFMVRLEDNRGIVARNHYRWSAPPKGPAVPARTKEQWMACLESTNALEQLSALVWLTGGHLLSHEQRKIDHNQESVSDSKLFESVRDDARTATLMAKLRSNKNSWVRDYAKLGLLKEDTQ